MEDPKQEEEDVIEDEKKPEQEQEETEHKEKDELHEEDCEIEREIELDEEQPQKEEEDECNEYPECTLVGFRESDEEKSLDLTESPRPLSQDTRNLTASELLLNKSVDF